MFKAGVVGAGTMGAEIAQVIASAGVPVVLKDTEQSFVEAGLEKAGQITGDQLEGLVDKGKITREQADSQAEDIVGAITGATDYAGFGDVDFVIEAVPERMPVKQSVLAELDAVCPGHAILASSTSSLSITEMAEATRRPGKVVGFHFFHPASMMRLIEVVEGEDTSEETLQAATNFAGQIRKTAIRCADAPGFVVNRILSSATAEVWKVTDEEGLGGQEVDRIIQEDLPREQAVPANEDLSPKDTLVQRTSLKTLVEACLVLQEGESSAKDIEIGMMMGAGILPGPFTRADRQGLDTLLESLERARSDWGESFKPPLILRRLVGQGRLGQKSGQGFFAYPRPDEGQSRETIALETCASPRLDRVRTDSDPRGDIGIVWLTRAPANPLSPQMIAELADLWAEVDGKLRAVIFASSTIFTFSAGADIKQFAKMSPDTEGRDLIDAAHAFMRAMERSSTVTIAAVNSLALGGGCELAMACDLRLAAQSASFGQPEVNLGIIPGFGGTQRLPRLVGEAKALEMNLLGEPIGAYEALELGLVNQVVPDHELFDTALSWARKLAGQAPLAVQQIKRVSAAGDMEEGIEEEQQGFSAVFGSEDAKEGIGAFLSKRQAEFKGR
ncbi:MAG: 3-hydroxyacyl-CoA dehydrogenase/enoyl-CoA hydratase family protein [Thermoleophilaceae bacterium]